MASLDDDLERWREAALIDAATVAAIRDFERARREGGGRPTIIEAVVYLALAIIGVGVAVLASSQWADLPSGTRVAVPAIAGVFALVVGFALRVSGDTALRRGGDVAWLLTVGLAMAVTAVATFEADWESEAGTLATGLVGLGVGVALWAVSHTHAQLLGMAAPVPLIAASMGMRVEGDGEAGPALFGVTLAVAAGVALALAEGGWLTPRTTARIIGAVGLAVGAWLCAISPDPAVAQVVVFVAGGALVALSIARGVFVYMIAGVGALFVGLITVIVRNVDDASAAAGALIVVGVLLLGAVVVLSKAKPWAAREAGAPSP